MTEIWRREKRSQCRGRSNELPNVNHGMQDSLLKLEAPRVYSRVDGPESFPVVPFRTPLPLCNRIRIIAAQIMPNGNLPVCETM